MVESQRNRLRSSLKWRPLRDSNCKQNIFRYSVFAALSLMWLKLLASEKYQKYNLFENKRDVCTNPSLARTLSLSEFNLGKMPSDTAS